MFHFLFMNIAHLISRTKQKLKFLADLCDANTLFPCFCETFLHDGIGDIEIQLPDFSITRSDRLSRVGGGVCIYMKKSVNFTTCVNYSNSVCELLILKLHTPSLIAIQELEEPYAKFTSDTQVFEFVQQYTMIYLVKGLRKIQIYHVNSCITAKHVHKVIKNIQQG